jgi:hypothetical protein
MPHTCMHQQCCIQQQVYAAASVQYALPCNPEQCLVELCQAVRARRVAPAKGCAKSIGDVEGGARTSQAANHTSSALTFAGDHTTYAAAAPAGEEEVAARSRPCRRVTQQHDDGMGQQALCRQVSLVGATLDGRTAQDAYRATCLAHAARI